MREKKNRGSKRRKIKIQEQREPKSCKKKEKEIRRSNLRMFRKFYSTEGTGYDKSRGFRIIVRQIETKEKSAKKKRDIHVLNFLV